VPRTVKSPRHRRHHEYQLGVAELLGLAATNTLRQARMIGGLIWPLAKTILSSARDSFAEWRARTAEERAEARANSSRLLKLAPPTPFNVSITNQRAFAGLTLPLAEAKQLGKAHGASINDVVLWLCATALRDYLKESRELPTKSLVAGVPVSLRAEGDDSMNNQVTMSLVDLATHLPDARERLQAIQTATASLKNQMGTFSALIPTDFPSLGAPWLLSGLVSLYGRSGLADRIRISNVAISNVPGVQVPLYLAGAKMLDYYPVSIVIHGVALNVTVQSYMGQLCFGLISCRRAVPDVRDIAKHMQRAYEQLREMPAAGEDGAAAVQAAAKAPALPARAGKKAPALPVRAGKKAPALPVPGAGPGAARPRRAQAAVVPAKARPKLRVVAKPAAKAPVRARAPHQAKAG
jgi:WS/DGAT/MGAT family acyltransferase